MTKKFREFIEDSADDKDLAGEFWKEVAKPDFTSEDIKLWLEGKGYEATDRQIHKIGRIRDKVDQEFNVFDKDY